MIHGGRKPAGHEFADAALARAFVVDCLAPEHVHADPANYGTSALHSVAVEDSALARAVQVLQMSGCHDLTGHDLIDHDLADYYLPAHDSAAHCPDDFPARAAAL